MERFRRNGHALQSIRKDHALLPAPKNLVDNLYGVYIYTLLERMNWKNLPPGSVFGFHGHPFGAPSMLAHDSSRECMVL